MSDHDIDIIDDFTHAVYRLNILNYSEEIQLHCNLMHYWIMNAYWG